MGKKIKYSEAFERDWKFYTNNLDKFSFWGGDVIFEPIHDVNGISAKEFFHKLDSTGMEKMKSKTCSEPKLVADVLRFKKALNFHIKQWSEGYNDCGMPIQEYLEMFSDPPDWVETSFRNQLYKVVKQEMEKWTTEKSSDNISLDKEEISKSNEANPTTDTTDPLIPKPGTSSI